MQVNGVEVISSKGDNLVCFLNSPCIITMQQKDVTYSNSEPKIELGIYENSDVVIYDGKIIAMGKGAAEPFLKNKSSLITAQKAAPHLLNEPTIIDASRLTIMPGLIDCHTHPLFEGSRAKETVLKSQGMSYEEIAARGGGILHTTKETRQASNEQLKQSLFKKAQKSLSLGIVLLECKTGYGLSPTEELRHLKIIKQTIETALEEKNPLPLLAPTLLGPHAPSPDYRGLDAYLDALIEHLPQYYAALKPLAEKEKCLPIAVDIFVERNYFSAEQADKWLTAALRLGFDTHIHADEFSRSGGCELAIALAMKQEQSHLMRNKKSGRVLSVDHCQYATDLDLKRLASHGVAAVALPTTSFFSNIPYVEAMKWRSAGVRVAIASDFNPGSSPANNLWFAAYLALTKCGFSLEEVLAGVTLNAAFALGNENKFGTLAINSPANLIAFEGKVPEDFFASPLGEHLKYVSLDY